MKSLMFVYVSGFVYLIVMVFYAIHLNLLWDFSCFLLFSFIILIYKDFIFSTEIIVFQSLKGVYHVSIENKINSK
jgi:hypothetical protein